MVDADAVVALRPDGSVLKTLGGVGTGDGAFLDPVDIDPTNGQTVYVVDRGAGAVLQFTSEGRLVRSISVPDVEPGAVFRGPASSDRMRGVPVAVAAGPGGSLYVADASRGHVLQFDASGAVSRVLGAGRLVDPVDLAIGEDGTLWVVDAGLGGLKAFDPFGAAAAVIDLRPHVDGLVSVSIRGAVLTVAASALVEVVLDLEPGRFIVQEPRVGLRGAVRVGDRLVGLTQTGLVALGAAFQD